jgi:hypothetical protein
VNRYVIEAHCLRQMKGRMEVEAESEEDALERYNENAQYMDWEYGPWSDLQVVAKLLKQDCDTAQLALFD